MRLRTLGGLALEGSSFKRAKPLVLLAYLAVAGPKERRFLQELFYRDAKNPQNSLATALTRLRKASPELVGSDGVSLWCGVDSDAGDILKALDHKRNQRAVELYRGPFLAGVDPSAGGVELEEWIFATRESLASRVRLALLELAEDQAGAGEFRVGAELAQQAYLLTGAPEPEGEQLERLFVLLQAGGHGEAWEVAKEARAFDLILNVSVEEAKAALYKEADTHPKTLRILPAQATSFVGREQELSEVRELLAQPECRVLTLVGGGGFGKTRLALEAAQEQLELGGFPDGVVFVALEALTDVASLPGVIVGALGLTLSGREDAGSIVKRFLTEKKLLLVLDNFEQLLEGASFVHELIDHCPGLRLLITSRERLNLQHEWAFPVESLAYPEESTGLERAGYFDAVQLFLERARQARHGFRLSSETLPAVMRICELVAGMPLALELAASWLRALPVGDIAREIEAGIDLLESSARDMPSRHRSIRAVFDHSWALLSEGERKVLRQLGVFRGGFTREAAAVVAGATLPMLARLVDKSLLSMSTEGRYDRHPLLTQYSLEKLLEHHQEKEGVEEKHGRYFLGLVRELEPDLWTLQRKEAFRAFVAELANIRAAWDWAITNLRVAEIEETTPAMFSFFEFRLSEGLEYFGTTFRFFGSIAERLDANNPHHIGALGTVLIHRVLHPHEVHRNPDYRRVRSVAERGIALLESAGEPRGLARGLVALGESFHPTAPIISEQAREWFQQALALARKHGRASDIFYALRAMAWAEDSRRFLAEEDLNSEYDQFLQDALAELRALNNLPGVVYFLTKRAYSFLRGEKRFNEAEVLLWEGNRLAEEIGHHDLVITSLNELADVSLELDAIDEAAAHLREAYRRTEEVGLVGKMPHILVRLGRVATARGDIRSARKLLLRSMKAGWAREDIGLALFALLYFAELVAVEGNPAEAVMLLAPFRQRVHDTYFKVEQILAELEASLTPEEFAAALERGRGKTLDEIMNELLPEL